MHKIEESCLGHRLPNTSSTPQAVIPFDARRGYMYYLELAAIPLSVVTAICIVFFIIWGCCLLSDK